MYEPAIKWSGSKRSQAAQILEYFPKNIDTYYEPFCGGASVLRQLLEKQDITVNSYICSDINPDLINLWNMIKNEPVKVSKGYELHWNILNEDNDINRKRKYFEYVRDRYNEEHNPIDFMFIMRTTTNGMPRYNKQGDFNNSFHITRNGIKPETLKKIILEWSNLLNEHNVVFKCCSYEDIKPNKTDFLYLDPPYAATKGMYFGKLETSSFYTYLENIKCSYILSYDGISGEDDNTVDLPTNLYDKHIYLKSGNSSFKRTIGKSKDSIVYESLYLKGV